MKYTEQATKINSIAASVYAAKHIGEVASFPSVITVTTTLNCNYRCRMCYQKSYDKAEIAWEMIEKIEDVLPFVESMQIFGGEPLLYSRFDDLVLLCRKNGVIPWTITNGSLLDKERAKLLAENGFGAVKFSMDAGTEKTYKFVRGGNFAKVMSNVAGLALERTRINSSFPHIELNFVAMKSNVHEIGKLAAIGANVGADQINVFYMRAVNEESALDSVYFHQEYSDEQMLKGVEMAKRSGIRITIPKLFSEACTAQEMRGSTVCHDPWKYFLFGPSGDCAPCCGGYPAIGNLARSDFQEVWNGPVVQKLRTTVNTENEPKPCRECFGRKQKSDNIFTHFSSKSLYENAAAKLSMHEPK